MEWLMLGWWVHSEVLLLKQQPLQPRQRLPERRVPPGSLAVGKEAALRTCQRSWGSEENEVAAGGSGLPQPQPQPPLRKEEPLKRSARECHEMGSRTEAAVTTVAEILLLMNRQKWV